MGHTDRLIDVHIGAAASTASTGHTTNIVLPSGVLLNHVGRLLADHDDRRIRIARYDQRHDRSVNDAQAADAMNPQPLIDNSHWV